MVHQWALMLVVALQFANSDRDKRPIRTSSRTGHCIPQVVECSTVYHVWQAFVGPKPLCLRLILLARSLLLARQPNSLQGLRSTIWYPVTCFHRLIASVADTRPWSLPFFRSIAHVYSHSGFHFLTFRLGDTRRLKRTNAAGPETRKHNSTLHTV
ncbi:hypothetical protein FVEG_15087 [Fusarium verticillioides 7600]|uniref:Secreted protein n=1 Tax=Gibberella moniliformis (strain M3125 / FGSC 7600) TaxID=334819 RepID=W7LN13_GIBM7|nr:hypothetical protein FVEG_15087 [Fusarium verticillioides 7600]EWG39881.1 hypothetical protein FVEG_15087 [Fusarium verticillioides 7600]